VTDPQEPQAPQDPQPPPPKPEPGLNVNAGWVELPSLELPGSVDSLDALAHYIKDAAAKAGLTAKQAYGLRLAMDEIATNIANHGYLENNLTGNIRVSGKMSLDELILMLEDTGPEFDPRALLTKSVRIRQSSMEDKPIGGLGIYLAVKSLTRFDYRYTGTHNRNIFVMKRPSSPL